MANDLIVRILGDTKGLERSFAQANTTTAQFGRKVETTGAKVDKVSKSFRNLGTAFAGGFAAAEVARGIKSAIDVASGLQEQISASNVVFEDSAAVIQDWSKTTADSIGIARDQALQAANTFGSIFDAAGQSSQGAAELSKSVVQLAGDLASFADTNVDDALQALRSGLSGEIEPLRRFRVFLTEAAVAQEAMAQSGKNSAKELTQGEKIMARWSLILDQTTKAQGDAARTADSYANQTRRLSANIRDLQGQIGGPLLTVVNRFVEDLLSASDAATKLADNLRGLGDVVIPAIEIPLRIVGLDGDGKGGKSTGRKAVEKFVSTSIFGVVGLLDDAVRGEGIFGPGGKPNENELAKKFESNFTPFLDGLEKGGNNVAKKVKQAADKIAAFGEAGFKPLTKSLRQVREERDKARAEAEKIAQERRDTAAAELLAGLGLNIDRAALTSGLRDDLAALELMKRGLEGLISRGQDVNENQSRLVQTIGQIAETRRQIAERAQQALQASQFRQIGLTAEGGEVIPGVDNLRKQFESLSQRLVGSDVPRKLQDRMRLVGKFLAKGAKDATVETRKAIRELFSEIRGTFDSETKKGPPTKTTSLNANKILDGFGLGRDMEKELRARLSSFNSAGKALAGGGNRPTGQFVGGTIVVESHNTTTLDGEVVGRSVTRSQQKQRRRNTKQKRGPNSGV